MVFTARTRIKALAITAAAALAATTAVGTSIPASAASPDELPVSITNKTGQSGPVYLYILGVDLNSNKLGYVDKSGQFTPWSLPGGPVPTPAPDVSIPGPSDGSNVTVKVPKNLSGRVYFSFGKKLDFGLVNAGLVQPA